MGNSGSGQRNQRTKVCSTGHLTLILSVVDPISQPSTHEPTQRSHQGNNDSEREKEVARERERGMISFVLPQVLGNTLQ